MMALPKYPLTIVHSGESEGSCDIMDVDGRIIATVYDDFRGRTLDARGTAVLFQHSVELALQLAACAGALSGAATILNDLGKSPRTADQLERLYQESKALLLKATPK